MDSLFIVARFGAALATAAGPFSKPQAIAPAGPALWNITFPPSCANAQNEPARIRINVSFMLGRSPFQIKSESLLQTESLHRSVGCHAEVRNERNSLGDSAGRKHCFDRNGDLDRGFS